MIYIVIAVIAIAHYSVKKHQRKKMDSFKPKYTRKSLAMDMMKVGK